MGTAENPYAGQGSVLLDIGDGVGALVVVMPPAMDGVEVEIRPAEESVSRDHDELEHDHQHRHHSHQPGKGAHRHEDQRPGEPEHGPGHHPHVAVVARPVGEGLVYSLVFPELVEGRYELYRKLGGPVELSVSITGGQVTEARWPQS